MYKSLPSSFPFPGRTLLPL